MKENNEYKPDKKNQPSKETDESIENGRKAIESQKKTDPKDPAEKEHKDKEDAANWRNEG